MKKILLLTLLLSAMGWAQTRMIPHITRSEGGFTTELLLHNPTLSQQSLRLQGFAEDGSAMEEFSMEVPAGQVVNSDPLTLWGVGSGIASVVVIGSEAVRVAASYQNSQGSGSPAQVDASQSAKAWEIFPGDWNRVFDGLAVVNTGSAPANLRIIQKDYSGTVLQSQDQTTLPVRAKALVLLGGPGLNGFQPNPRSIFQIEADQPIALTAIRGDLPAANFLWANTARVFEATSTPKPSFQITGIPAGFPGAFSAFNQYIEVFGVHLFASSRVEATKLVHAAKVMAHYLDNDQNGRPDDPAVVQAMVGRNASLFMFASESDPDASIFESQFETIVGTWALQDLRGDETFPGGAANGQFDATLEEVLHLISDNGYALAYPGVFGTDVGTALTNAMDIARGGRFLQIPNPYPAGAWYTYDDQTCEYNCMATEYFYWALTSILGGQDFPGRLSEIENEWRLNTATKVMQTDTTIYQLLTDPAYKLPTVLPDGNYGNVPVSTVAGQAALDLQGYKIAFASSAPGDGSDIWIMNPDGSGAKNLTPNTAGADLYPEWGPQARWIYYTSNAYGGDAIELYAVNTTGMPAPVRLSQFGREVRSLAVSPDNQTMALGIMSGAVPLGADLGRFSSDLYLVSMDKVTAAIQGDLLTLEDLTMLLGEAQSQHLWHEQPDWVRVGDQNWLAYSRTMGYDTDAETEAIHLVRPNGTGDLMLMDDDSMPRWQPNGTLVTFGGQFLQPFASNASIKRFFVEGLAADAGAFSLSPDGRYLLFETSDVNRKAGIARAIFTGEATENPFEQISELNAFEPRWSPVPLPGQ